MICSRETAAYLSCHCHELSCCRKMCSCHLSRHRVRHLLQQKKRDRDSPEGSPLKHERFLGIINSVDQQQESKETESTRRRRSSAAFLAATR